MMIPAQWEHGKLVLYLEVDVCMTPKNDIEFLNNLTRRERQVFDLLITGMSNKEIAYDLHISDSAVKHHVRHILRKSSVRGRIDLIHRFPVTVKG